MSKSNGTHQDLAARVGSFLALVPARGGGRLVQRDGPPPRPADAGVDCENSSDETTTGGDSKVRPRTRFQQEAIRAARKGSGRATRRPRERNGADVVASRSGRGLAATPGLIAATGFLSILRKEVIQPQVPLRLPCYDLVPITGFIFGACLSAPTTSDAPRFGGLTGGVYKAQEHIHRGNADPRLLAIPASCGRVAARNPN